MRVFWYECRKFLNVKLLLLLMLFTYFYVQVYYFQILIFPGLMPGSDWQTYISKTLRDEVGETLPKSKFYLLEEIRQDMLSKKNKLIQESEILAAEGITDSDQMDEVTGEYVARMERGDEAARQVVAEIDRILVFDGSLENSVADQIQAVYDDLEEKEDGCVNFLCDSREEAVESAKKTLFWYGGNTNPDPVMVEYLANFYENDQLSLLPPYILTLLQTSFSDLAVAMLISCIVLVLPVQIRERLSGVRELQGSSVVGRKLWDRQLLASLTVSMFACLFQTGAYIAALYSSDITYYWNYPTYAMNGGSSVLFPFTVGELILCMAGLMTLYMLACVVWIHLISKTAGNYVVGYAMVLAPFLLLSLIADKLFVRCIWIYSSLWETIWPYLAVLVMLLIAVVIASIMVWRHRRRDVMG